MFTLLTSGRHRSQRALGPLFLMISFIWILLFSLWIVEQWALRTLRISRSYLQKAYVGNKRTNRFVFLDSMKQELVIWLKLNLEAFLNIKSLVSDLKHRIEALRRPFLRLSLKKHWSKAVSLDESVAVICLSPLSHILRKWMRDHKNGFYTPKPHWEK